MSQKILRLKQVQAQTGLSRSSIYAFQSTGNFPKSVKLGSRSVGWLESEVGEWIASKVQGKKEGAK